MSRKKSVEDAFQQQPLSRLIARGVLFVAFVGAGVSLAMAFMGQNQLILPICGASVLVGIGILAGGAILVARNK